MIRFLLVAVLLTAACAREAAEYTFEGGAESGNDLTIVWKAPSAAVETEIEIDLSELCVNAHPKCIVTPRADVTKVFVTVWNVPDQGFASVTGDMWDADGKRLFLCEREKMHGKIKAKIGNDRLTTYRSNRSNLYDIDDLCWIEVLYDLDEL